MSNNYGYTNPFSVCFTMMKLRYHDYDSSIEKLNFVSSNDKVNVFISFESVLNNLSMIKDLDNKLLLERNFPFILESEAINLCAHYKKFFKGNGLDTRVFLYSTDLGSENFKNFKYNDEYRSYFLNKYLQNPKFQLLGRKLMETSIPRIQRIMQFIPDVYFISGKDIEGSIIPYIIFKLDPSRKNFIISTDKYDTQYLMNNKDFCVHYIKRSFTGSKVFFNFEKCISDIFNENCEKDTNADIFKNPYFYSTLLAGLGDKTRSIDPLKGYGCKTILKSLNNAITNGIIGKDTSTINIILNSFPEDCHERIMDNFYCTNIDRQYINLGNQDLFNIQSQIVDRFDYNSLLQLNREDYKEYPLMLPELTG